jgi:hypothetical protein
MTLDICRRKPGEDARHDLEGRASDPGRMGIRADRQARRTTAVPDHLRQLRKEEPRHHDEHGVFEMGIDLPRRPDGRGDDRPPGPPWAHPAVRGRELSDETRPHAAKTLGKSTRGLMGIFRRFFWVFSLDKTRLLKAANIWRRQPDDAWIRTLPPCSPTNKQRARRILR